MRDLEAENAWIDRLFARGDLPDETHAMIHSWYDDPLVSEWLHERNVSPKQTSPIVRVR